MVDECFWALKKLAENNQVRLIWIPAHQGFQGNKKAGELAKAAASSSAIGPEPMLPISLSQIKLAVEIWGMEKHKSKWITGSSCRQTKELIKLPNPNVSRILLKYSRETVRSAVQILTGHNTLNKHLFIMGRSEVSTCRFCETADETSLHFLGRCDRFITARLDTFERHQLTPEDIRNATLPSILSYIKDTGRISLSQARSGD